MDGSETWLTSYLWYTHGTLSRYSQGFIHVGWLFGISTIFTICSGFRHSVVDQPACLYVRRSELGFTWSFEKFPSTPSNGQFALNSSYVFWKKLEHYWIVVFNILRKNSLIKLFGKNILGVTPPSLIPGSRIKKPQRVEVMRLVWHGRDM